MNWISIKNLDLKALAEKYKSYNWIEVLLIMKNPKKKSETVLRMDNLYRERFNRSNEWLVEKIQKGNCLLEQADNGEEFYWQLTHAAFKNVYAIAFVDDVVDKALEILKQQNNGK